MTSKIEVGDKLHLEYVVKSVTLFDDGTSLLSLMRLNCDGNEEESCRQSMTVRGSHEHPAIVKHLPKPYEPEIDDTVRLNALAADPLSPYKVIAVHAGRAWCRNVSTGVDKFYNFNLLVFVSKG